MKTCTRCKEQKPLEHFGADRHASDGLNFRCRPCAAAIGRESRAKNRARSNEASRRWAAKNPDRWKEIIRDWHRRNPGYATAKVMEREAQKLRATPSWMDPERVEAVYALARKCRDEGMKVEVDHLVPLRGRTVCGLHTHDNLAVVERRDNMSKGNRRWPDMP
jgi:hypothetical protein